MKSDKRNLLNYPSTNFRTWAKENFITLIGLPLKDFDNNISWEENNEMLVQIPMAKEFEIPEIENFTSPF